MDKCYPDRIEGVGGSLTVYDTEESPLCIGAGGPSQGGCPGGQAL